MNNTFINNEKALQISDFQSEIRVEDNNFIGNNEFAIENPYKVEITTNRNFFEGKTDLTEGSNKVDEGINEQSSRSEMYCLAMHCDLCDPENGLCLRCSKSFFLND